MAEKKNHEGPHKYERMEIGRKGHVIYKCILPDCPHFLPSAHLVIGRETVCKSCSSSVVYTKEMFSNDLKQAICENCREIKRRQAELMKTL